MNKNLIIGGVLVVVAVGAFMAGRSVSSADSESTSDSIEMTPLAMVGDAERGKALFVSEGCVICHSINGVGGQAAPGLDAREWPNEVGAYDFAARMWRGAAVMGDLQRLELGYQIDLTGQELADLTSFSLDE
ncbi:MAG: c-type cytochrome, partial [Pseudomonadota bacterium]